MGVLIKQLPKEERPRERLITLGEKNLSNEELLAIILKTGTKNISAKQMAGNILKEVENIYDLNNLSLNKLTTIKGIGKTKATYIKASLELGKRVNKKQDYIEKIKINNSKVIFDLMINDLKNQKQEYFYCLYLDNKKNLISKKLLYIGTINASIVHPREIFKEAYLLSASSIICIHNHPGNDITPSEEDIRLTKSLINIGVIQGIPIIDHIIITDNNYYSFYENNNI